MLRVWAKNQLIFEIFEKILKFRHQNLNGKVIFYPFSLPSSRTFVIVVPEVSVDVKRVDFSSFVTMIMPGKRDVSLLPILDDESALRGQCF